MKSWILCIGLALSTSALAGENNGDRAATLRAEMVQLASKGEWPAVEQRYVELVKIKRSRVEAGTHVLGGVAAHHAQDIDTAVKRLRRAGREGRERLKALRAGYGTVDITARNSRQLMPAAALTDPRARAILERATKSLNESGKYRGWMPVGVYTLGGRSFAVSPSRTIQVR